MENEKKSSRLGVRLSAVMIAVLLVVCMAVPAFAATVSPDQYNNLPFSISLPDGYSSYILCLNASKTEYYAFALDEIPEGYPRVEFIANDYRFKGGASFMRCTISKDGTVLSDWVSTTDAVSLPVNSTPSYDWYGNVPVYQVDGSIFFQPVLPPPPDPLESVGSGLVVVMDWVGSVVSAVVSGPMSGLLILLAVPVAITLLLVAFIVIRRIIWGA